MIIAITGTPGTGKTTLCSLIGQRGYKVIKVKDYCEEHGLLGEYDEGDGSYLIDLELFDRDMSESEFFNSASEECIFLDSHLSHLLKVNGAVVLRCQPAILRKRLENRDYSRIKIEDNVVCEMVDVIAMEVKRTNVPSIELDTSSNPSDFLAERVVAFIESFPETDGFDPPCSRDWIKEMATY